MNLMHDPNHPEPEDGVVENLLDNTQAKAVVVRMEFVPIKPGGETVTKRKRFPTGAAATEYINNAMPPNPRLAIGSPKQLHAKRARFLGVDGQWLAQHNLICHMEMEYDPNAIAQRTPARRAQSDGPAAGVESPGGPLVFSGPPPADLLRSVLDSEPLSLEEAEFSEGGDDEAEDSGTESESET